MSAQSEPGATTRAGHHDDPRATVRWLMRGTLNECKIGEDGKTAVLEALRASGITDAATGLELTTYAYGFARGLHHEPFKHALGLCDRHARIMREGYDEGLAVNPMVSFPAPLTP